MTTEVGDETAKKASSRKRKQTSEETTVERKTNPRPPGTSKKAKTEKTDAGPSLPTSKNFLAHAQELKLNGDSVEDITPTEDEPLYTLTAKPHKNATGSYGWTASVPKGKIKVDIEGEEVELPVTISLNITVQGSKK
ncbi:9794_t:CDS:2 [Funneliformis mosseae]|uniref:9794_t:CDS:1 n=1 Tax=Funneliformis mosseae TaxID=27381 RepID=A0A9N9FK09_FUNMO|nr:9794_t:CDS:2 [Funneliformis mosseae]